MSWLKERRLPLRMGGVLAVVSLFALFVAAGPAGAKAASGRPTATPIQHLVVVFQENVSFDHYFGTYPNAANPNGEPQFVAAKNTPSVNGLTPALRTHNPNGVNPFRLDRSQALTCDQDHDYAPEQLAFDHGLMDMFPENTQSLDCSPPFQAPKNLVMGYYDGNTVTAEWNYAQHFAMSDNSYGTTFGPSTPGALNLISGQTHGGILTAPDDTVMNSNGTVYGDEDPTYDDCSSTAYPTLSMKSSNKNIGELLNAAGISWGWFQGGFRPSTPYDPKTGAPAVCDSSHDNIGGVSVPDYSPHHEPFQYYAATANPHHLAPASVAEIGHNGRANHQYDLSDFYRALQADNMPAVSFIKAAKYQDGHAGYSDPLDEQHFLVKLINTIEQSPDWSSTAIVIAYDDSDGWYDHQMGPIVSQSQDPLQDGLTGPGLCGTGPALGGFQDRCGYGPRLPLLVISPYSKRNFVDNSVTDQTSILGFIEDNWLHGERIGGGSFDALSGSLNNMFNFSSRSTQPLFLNPITGEPR